MASLSHELKNRISIIKEQAGLLKDYSALVEQGRPIDPARINQIGSGLTRQVEMTDAILVNMNQFAHSVDETCCPTDVNDLLGRLTSLAKRAADLHRVHLRFCPSHSTLVIITSPFLLMNLIWLGLETLMHAIGDRGTIELKVEKHDNGGGSIQLHAQTESRMIENDPISEAFQFLAKALEAGVEWQRADRTLRVYFPAAISNDGLKGNLRLLFWHSKEHKNKPVEMKGTSHKALRRAK